MLRRPLAFVPRLPLATVALAVLVAALVVGGAAGCDACGGAPPISGIDDAGAPGGDAGRVADAGTAGVIDGGAGVDAGAPSDAGAVDAGAADGGAADAGAAGDAGTVGDAGFVVDSGGSPPPSALRITGGSGASASGRFGARVRVGAPLPAVLSTDGARALSPSVPESP